jgi:hypothetical protein
MIKRVYHFSCSILFFLGYAAGTASLAQDAGQIAGTVTDPSGALVPGISVTATNLGTNATRAVVSNSAGAFVILNLPPAQYDLSTTPFQGFGTSHVQLEVTVGGKMTADIALSTKTDMTIEVTSQGGCR